MSWDAHLVGFNHGGIAVIGKECDDARAAVEGWLCALQLVGIPDESTALQVLERDDIIRTLLHETPLGQWLGKILEWTER